MKFEIFLMKRMMIEYIKGKICRQLYRKNPTRSKVIRDTLSHICFPLRETSLDFPWVKTHNASFCAVIMALKI